ncbi:MAG: ABC-type transport auxiliary lipoprotein family protein [Pseudoxanthomonas sp.]
MSVLHAGNVVLPIALLGLLGGCAGGLLGSGGKPSELYRFGALESGEPTVQVSNVQRTVALERVHFAPEIEGDRILAVHDGSARYIKGSRWVTAAPSLFAYAVVQSFQSRAPGLRITASQHGELTGYSLMIYISRFEAQYQDAGMVLPPVIAIEGDATLYGLADRQVISQRHFVTRVAATENRAGAIAATFDHATTGYVADVVDWVTALDALQRTRKH